MKIKSSMFLMITFLQMLFIKSTSHLSKKKSSYFSLSRLLLSQYITPNNHDNNNDDINNKNNKSKQEFKENVTIVSETLMFHGYRDIVRRSVRLPNDKQILYDVVQQGHPSVLVFTWDRNSSTTTLVREYHPGPQKFMYGTVAGMYELKKHSSPLSAAQFELEEEAQMSSRQWYPLLGQNVTVPLDKYSDNRFFPFLALDCELVSDPKPQDEEEYILVERQVSYKRLMTLVNSGQINVASSYTILLGIRKLQELGIPVLFE